MTLMNHVYSTESRTKELVLNVMKVISQTDPSTEEDNSLSPRSTPIDTKVRSPAVDIEDNSGILLFYFLFTIFYLVAYII